MKRLTPLRAIRAFCLDCAGGRKGVEECTANLTDIKKTSDTGNGDYEPCPLYEYRFGNNPRRKGMGGPGKPFLASKRRAQLPESGQKRDDSTINLYNIKKGEEE